MSDSFSIRRATVRDAEIIARHRARMFEDMGDLHGAGIRAMRENAKARLEQWIESGDYLGWLASPADKIDNVIAGAGVQLIPILPRPRGDSVGEGRQGTIVNVFTEPEWRRRGVASLLMKEIIAWARTANLDRLLLHASKEGRSLYEKLGFKESNEMRFVDSSL